MLRRKNPVVNINAWLSALLNLITRGKLIACCEKRQGVNNINYSIKL
jgi:hypothetical protein